MLTPELEILAQKRSTRWLVLIYALLFLVVGVLGLVLTLLTNYSGFVAAGHKETAAELEVKKVAQEIAIQESLAEKFKFDPDRDGVEKTKRDGPEGEVVDRRHRLEERSDREQTSKLRPNHDDEVIPERTAQLEAQRQREGQERREKAIRDSEDSGRREDEEAERRKQLASPFPPVNTRLKVLSSIKGVLTDEEGGRILNSNYFVEGEEVVVIGRTTDRVGIAKGTRKGWLVKTDFDRCLKP